jgi:hypothetical protein
MLTYMAGVLPCPVAAQQSSNRKQFSNAAYSSSAIQKAVI